jgi:hypothetical protein
MKKKIIGWSVLFILLFCGISYGILQYSYSTGQRSGKLVKISKKGFLPKTYEGTLDLGSGDALTWQFSVHDESLGEQLTSLSGQNVTLEYRELLWRIFYETKYDITGYKVMDDRRDSNKSLCRLVHVLRQDRNIVEQIRPMIQNFAPDLLNKIRNCQN